MCLTRHRRILKKDPPFPKDVGPLAKDVIQRLLTKDPKKRLGSGPNGAENVKKQPFYQVDLISCLQYLENEMAEWAVNIHDGAALSESHLGELSVVCAMLIRMGASHNACLCLHSL